GEIHVSVDDDGAEVGVVLNSVAFDNPRLTSRKQEKRRQIRRREQASNGGERSCGMPFQQSQREERARRAIVRPPRPHHPHAIIQSRTSDRTAPTEPKRGRTTRDTTPFSGNDRLAAPLSRLAASRDIAAVRG